jgi:hypothetical protein
VYWKGEVPDALYEEIKRQRSAGVRIRLDRADYSGSELTAAMNQVVEQPGQLPGLVPAGSRRSRAAAAWRT